MNSRNSDVPRLQRGYLVVALAPVALPWLRGDPGRPGRETEG